MTIIETLRKPKIFKMAVFDLSGVAFIALMISIYYNYNFLLTFIVLMTIGVFTHFIFDIPTQLNYYIGLNEKVR